MFNQNQEGVNPKQLLQHPIPPPTHDTQYRAIGLVWGVYKPQDQLTRGEIILGEESRLETVLLGRVISVVKKHINLEQPHLWVVYPRTRHREDYLHLQIVGIWEPQTLNESLHRAETLEEETVSEVNSQAGYFSIRGELIFYSEAEQKIIIKVKRGTPGKPSFFKLKLNGVLPDDKNKLGWFWDIDVQLKAEELVVTEARKVAPLHRQGKREGGKKIDVGERPTKKIISPPDKKDNSSGLTKKNKPVPRRKRARSNPRFTDSSGQSRRINNEEN